MKHIIRIIAVLVGLLLIFSGLIKLNDPVGTAIKLEEYFEVFAQDFGAFFHSFVPLAIYLSVFLSSIEIILGVALIIRWRAKLVLILLLIMMVFFTFLTFYSAYFNKVTDCGCFGDAIKLKPWESFTKDIVLDVLLVVLLIFRRYLTPLFRDKVGSVIVLVTTALCLFIGWYAYQHLPYVDFRAYKVGSHIPSKMKASEPLRYKYVMEKDGNTQDFETYPTDTTWKFMEMVLLNPEAQPKITDYSVWNEEGDYTQQTFEGNKLLIFVHNVAKTNKNGFAEINKLVADLQQASGAKVEAIAFTSSDPASFDAFRHEVQLAVPYYFADATVLKTMMRANPGLMLLKNGTVLGQWHHNDVPTASQINELVNK